MTEQETIELVQACMITKGDLAVRVARSIIAHPMNDFGAEYGQTNCRDWTGIDIVTEEEHRAFFEGKM